MSTALVLGNGNVLVNLSDKLQVTDFYFPHVGQENQLAAFTNKMFVRINGEYFDLDHNEFEITPKYAEDSLVSESHAIHKKTQIEFVFYDFVIQNKPIFIRNFEVINHSNEDREIYVYFQNNFAIYENDIADTVVWYQPAKCLVHYKKDRYIASGSIDQIYQFTCAARTDNEGRGAWPNPSTGEMYFNPISNGSVNSCLSYKFYLKAEESKQTNFFHIAGHNFEEIEKLVTKLRIPSTKTVYTSTKKYWQNWVRSKTSHLFPSNFEIDSNENAEQEVNSPIFFENDDELNKKIFSLYKRSLLTIRTQIDNGGAIVAANDGKFTKEGGKDTYSYFWPRDAAYTVIALIESGFKELSDKYFEYAHRLITQDGYFLHKYYPSIAESRSSFGSSWHPWIDACGNFQLPIQEDETALNLIAAWKHYEKFADQEFLNKYWDKFIFPMLNFLGNYRYTVDYPEETIADFVSGFTCPVGAHKFNDTFAGSKLPRPSYDIWEIDRAITLFTCSTVYAGMIAGANLAKAFGKDDFSNIFNKFAADIKTSINDHFYTDKLGRFRSKIKCDPHTTESEYDDELDISMYAIWQFGLLDVNDPKVSSTMSAIEEKLKINSSIGGMARKENDHYLRTDNSVTGNPWFISSMWMAQYWICKSDLQKAKPYIKWVIEHTDDTGLMAEQADPNTGHGLSVKPLTWSHSEFVRTVNMMRGI